jgi:hypothetical protein
MTKAGRGSSENLKGPWIREASKLTDKVAELEIKLKYAFSESNAKRLTGELRKAQKERSKYKALLNKEDWSHLETRKESLKEQADQRMNDKKLEKKLA